ncbi:uncharacterized protein LOC123795682 [Ursus americanus]|uniref:uncharacterized protein LOC123795682 n=1 Tax=Ursus americanus TaxID=9643 RepID=UPI001E67CE50|nr:uncharacterized protein LOC123795682 [Ursus americanus]
MTKSSEDHKLYPQTFTSKQSHDDYDELASSPLRDTLFRNRSEGESASAVNAIAAGQANPGLSLREEVGGPGGSPHRPQHPGVQALLQKRPGLRYAVALSHGSNPRGNRSVRGSRCAGSASSALGGRGGSWRRDVLMGRGATPRRAGPLPASRVTRMCRLQRQGPCYNSNPGKKELSFIQETSGFCSQPCWIPFTLPGSRSSPCLDCIPGTAGRLYQKKKLKVRLGSWPRS